MIDRINREFDILASEQKRLEKLAINITIASPTFPSYVQTIKSVSILASNLTQSFTELLSHAQNKQLSKTQTNLIEELLSIATSSQTVINKIKNEKSQISNKIKSQNCSICGENIHESNIRQAIVGLEEESKQNFHMAMQQFNKIAEQPIYTKQENNQFEERLHYLLSEREKVLNINCNRIEQFAEIMDSALADLRKLKDLDLFKSQPYQQSSEFTNASKINENVSHFLQESFSKKIPPWIHKMFLKMITSYIKQTNEKKIEKSIQTSNFQYIDSKDVRQIVRQKQALQKQNKDLNDQLKQLKLLYKKLEEINFEYTGVIATLNRNIKVRQAPSKQVIKSRRNSKNLTKITKGDTTPREIQSNLDQEEPVSNYNIFETDQNHQINGKYNLQKRKRKQLNSLLPQIKKNKFENLSPLSGRQGKVTELKKEIKQEQANAQSLRNIQSEKVQKQQVLKIKEKNELSQENEIKNLQGSKNLSNDNNKKRKQLIKTEKLNRDPQISEDEDEEGEQANRQKRGKDKSKIVQSKKKNKYLQPEKKKNKTEKLSKANTSKKQNQNSGEVSVIREDQDSGLRQLYDYVSNIKLNKQTKNSIDQQQEDQHHTQLPNKRNSKKSMNSENKQNEESLETFNKRKNSKQMIILKKISKQLTEQIMNKRSSFYELVGQPQNQKGKKQKKVVETRQQQKTKTTEKKPDQQEEEYEQMNQCEQYEQEFEKDENTETNERNTEKQSSKNTQTYMKLAKLRKSQNTYLIKRKKHKQLTNLDINQQSQIRQSLTSLVQSKATQRKLFDILKTHNVIEKSVNYNDFSALLDKLDGRDQQNQEKEDKSSHKDKSGIFQSRLKDQVEERKPSIFQETEDNLNEQAHNSVYGRLFLNKAMAHKYESSMTKSYHKKILHQLDESQRNYCNKMYSDLCETKKMKRQTYQQFCSILRYPYQTLYSNFEAVKFMSEMSFQTFEYFFRKIVWIHRKCKNQKQHGVCKHIVSVRQELLELLHKNQSN